MEYNFREIEKKWQQRWVEEKTYQVAEDKSKPKFYVLNMFPYPSGAGLHVGHPLGYIASDIYARFKRLQGYNVLNPSRRGSTLRRQHSRTLTAIVSSWTRSVSASIGTGRCALARLSITSGHNGRSRRCLARSSATSASRLSLSRD